MYFTKCVNWSALCNFKPVWTILENVAVHTPENNRWDTHLYNRGSSMLNNNFTKDRCPIPMDTTVRPGPLKFSLQAIIDLHGPSIHSGHYTASINCCKKIFYCNDHTITEFGITDKNSTTAYVILYELIDT